MAEAARSRGRPLRTAIITLVVGLSVIGVAYLVIVRDHAIVYRATAVGCDAQVMYALAAGVEINTSFSDRWESEEVTVDHGDSAVISVVAARGCASPVTCELIEDGESVARATGEAGAVCTAWTGRR